jgi:hypothetical protein
MFSLSISVVVVLRHNLKRYDEREKNGKPAHNRSHGNARGRVKRIDDKQHTLNRHRHKHHERRKAAPRQAATFSILFYAQKQ